MSEIDQELVDYYVDLTGCDRRVIIPFVKKGIEPPARWSYGGWKTTGFTTAENKIIHSYDPSEA